MAKRYHELLGIQAPSLAAVKDNREANTYALMIVALIERGEPMSLAEIAARFERAGIEPADEALRSLKRCQPARPPVYRDGDMYELDVHDDELDLWLFRLGLRGPKVPRLEVVRKPPELLPDPETPLTTSEIEEAFRDANLYGWSAQRLALAVLDSHGGHMPGSKVVEVLKQLTKECFLRVESADRWRAMAVIVEADGSWRLDPDHEALRSTRKAVRDGIKKRRRWEAQGPDLAVLNAYRKRAEEQSAAHAAELARLKRVVLHAFPADAPRAVSLVVVATREFTTLVGEEMEILPALLASFDFIAAVNVRPLLRALSFDPGTCRLADLGPPQKRYRLNRRGRTLRITAELLIQGSCGITTPFGDPHKLRTYLDTGQKQRLRLRIESDVKSLFALYQYGRLHGAYRLRWGFVDDRLPVPWVHRDEPTLYRLIQEAKEKGLELEIVTAMPPSWKNPWARPRRCRVLGGDKFWERALVDEDGFVVEERDVQLARLASPVRPRG